MLSANSNQFGMCCNLQHIHSLSRLLENFLGERILEIGSKSQIYEDTINIYQYIGYIDIHFHSNTTSS